MERGGPSQALGQAWRAEARQMLHWWPRVRDGTLAQARLAHSRRPIRWAIERRLEAGPTGGVPQTAGRCRDLLKRRQAVWTFLRHAGVDPTNHAAERALRPGVLWRQGSLGTHRPEGARCVDAMMTVLATLTQPQRHVLDDVTAACAAARCGAPAPSLRPTLEALTQGMRPAASRGTPGER